MDAPLRTRTALPLLLVVALLSTTPSHSELSASFYDDTCPVLESIVRVSMSVIVSDEPRMAASILRLSFHDCVVQGCDASVLLADTPTFTGEQSASPNRGSIRGMDKIEVVKANVEAACSETVSCADILALAARDAVVLSGGPSWTVMLGRRDATTASQTAADINIPSPQWDLDLLTSSFAAMGLSQRDLVALSGAHTIGFTRGGALPLDPNSAHIFDNSYYENLIVQGGVLPSDQELFGADNTTNVIVESYVRNQSLFFSDFTDAMVRLGNMTPLTGANGEIRKNCSRIN